MSTLRSVVGATKRPLSHASAPEKGITSGAVESGFVVSRPPICRGLNDRDRGYPLLWGRSETAEWVAKLAPMVERLAGPCGSEGGMIEGLRLPV